MEREGTEPINPVHVVSEALDADIYFISGELDRSLASALIDTYVNAEQRTNCALILSTYGGDADAAFIIARFLKRFYKHFTLYVFGYCKSAGTLVALGADEIVMSPHAELGPLDVQLFKEDELGRQGSGLDIFQALSIINAQAFQIFENNFLNIKGRSGGTITTKTAADIATSLASQLLAPITAQIDPLRLGEMQRAINIAKQYGERLGASKEALDKLISDYPSHSFVIDFEEACGLFPQVRPPAKAEVMLEQLLRDELTREFGTECIYIPHQQGVLACLTLKADEQEDNDEDIIEEPGNGDENAGVSDGSADETAIRASRDNGQASEPSDQDPTLFQKNGRRKSGSHKADIS